MLGSSVLVVNRSYLPIHVTSARRAFTLIYRGTARALDHNYQTFDFDAWRRLEVNGDEAVGTGSGPIRVPRVIVLQSYDRVPRRYVRFSRVNVFVRDSFTCQYCARSLPRSGLNLDHVVPRALGGRSTWENVVCSCVDCNRRKGGRTPRQAGLRLLRAPRKPSSSPFVGLLFAEVRYEEWRPFLHIADSSGTRSRMLE